MAGTARVKRLGVLALLAMLLAPPPAGAAEKHPPSPKQWVWGEWDDEKGQERRQQREADRDRRREREQDRRSAEKQKRLADQRERLARKRERLAEKREQLAEKRERLATRRERVAAERERKAQRPSRRYENKRRYDHDEHGPQRDGHNRYGRNRYGLVSGSHRDWPRPRYHRPHYGHRPPRPHPCGPWMYDGRPYDPVAHWDDDDFWHWDGRWSPCGPHRPRVRRSTYVVHMTGDQVDPAGPADASGVANLLLLRDGNGSRGRICHRLSLRGTGTDAPLQAHLHEGRPGQSGPEVFDLDLPRNGRQGCRNADAWLVRRIERSPGSFYLDVHTRTHGTGVVRGQPARAYRS